MHRCYKNIVKTIIWWLITDSDCSLTKGAVDLAPLWPFPAVDKSMPDQWRSVKFAVRRDWLPSSQAKRCCYHVYRPVTTWPLRVKLGWFILTSIASHVTQDNWVRSCTPLSYHLTGNGLSSSSEVRTGKVGVIAGLFTWRRPQTWLITDRVSGESRSIGSVRLSVCFHSILWTNWPLTLIFGISMGHYSIARLELKVKFMG